MQLLEMGEAASTLDLNDYLTSKQCGEALTRAYPGYRWGVRANWSQGVVDVFCLDTPAKYGYRLHLRGLHADQMYSASAFEKACLAAGGEILERYGLNRTAFKADEYENAPVAFNGDIIGDTSK